MSAADDSATRPVRATDARDTRRGPADGDRELDAPDARLAPPSIVDWRRTARRIRLMLMSLGVVVLGAWLVIGVFGDQGLQPRLLAEFVGLALLLAFLGEVVVVGGAALRGMLRAGERGERLAGSDVSLLPPQLTRRRR